MSIFNELRQGAKRSGIPATVALILAIVAGYLVSWFSEGRWLGADMAFLPMRIGDAPWTVALYPFSERPTGDAAIGVLFACWWLWGIGGSVERDLGPVRYLAFFFVFAVLGALAYWLGSVITGVQRPLFTSWVPIAGVTVLWGVRNPTDTIILLVLPIQGRYLAWLSAALVFLATNSPQLAVFTCIPLTLAWAFAAEKLPIPYRAVARSKRVPGGRGAPTRPEYFDDVRKREKQREERERLRKLFESSLDDDEGKDK